MIAFAEGRGNYSIRRFREACHLRGHTFTCLDPRLCMIRLGEEPRMFHAGREITERGVVVPRRGAGVNDHDLAVLNQFTIMGYPMVNSVLALSLARNKLRALQLLARGGVKVPATVLLRSPSLLRDALDEVNGFPLIVKMLDGAQGKGVMLLETEEELASVLDTLWSLGENVLLQEFIEESRGRDLRVFVVGNKVVACMVRQAAGDEFRSNIHRGGQGTVVDPSPQVTRMALKAARVFGLDIAGVDILESREGPLVVEVNTSPGFEGLEQATGLDIAATIVDFTNKLSPSN